MNAPVKLPPEPTTGFPRAIWRTTAASARSLAIKRRLLETPRQIDVERARYTTQSYRASEGEPMAMRRAKMLLHLVRAMSITIDEGELIAGDQSLLPRMGVIAPEGAVTWVNSELDILPTRLQDRFNITAEQVHELREEVFPYWSGKTLEEIVATRVPPDIMKAVRGKAFSLNQTNHAQGHILPDVETWLRLGIPGFRTQVQKAPPTGDAGVRNRQICCNTAEIALTAAQTLFERYADLAAEIAQHSPIHGEQQSCDADRRQLPPAWRPMRQRRSTRRCRRFHSCLCLSRSIRRQQFLTGAFRPVHAALSAGQPPVGRLQRRAGTGTA